MRTIKNILSGIIVFIFWVRSWRLWYVVYDHESHPRTKKIFR